MSLQASWNSAIGIVGGLSRLKKISDEQQKTNETLNEQEEREVREMSRKDQAADWVNENFQGPLTVEQLAHARDVDYRRIESERSEANERSAQEHEENMNSLNRRFLDNRAMADRIENRRMGIGRSSAVASRINNQMAAQRAQEHIQQADTPRNSGTSAQEILRRASTFGQGGDY